LPEKELMQKSMHRADCTARFLCAWNKKEIHGNTGGTASAAKGVIRRRLFAFLYELSLKSHPIVYLLIRIIKQSSRLCTCNHIICTIGVDTIFVTRGH